MAKLVTSPISNFNVPALTTIQNNFDAIEAAIENTVSRDGSTPNQMEADLDINNHDILNAKIVNGKSGEFDSLSVGGQVVHGVDGISSLPTATQAEAEDGAINSKLMTPLRTKQAIEGVSVAVWDSGKTRTMKERSRDICWAGDFAIDLTGNNDSTTAIQTWLDQATSSGLAQMSKGVLTASGPLYLRKNTRLIGGAPDAQWGATPVGYGSGLGSIINFVGAGVGARWTDIDGVTDKLSFKPGLIFAGEGCFVENLTVRKIDGGVAAIDADLWDAAIYNPGMPRCGIRRVNTVGKWQAGVYLDATWSNTNTTLTVLHPEIEASSGVIEWITEGCWLRGRWGAVVKGTTRDPASYTDAAFVWSPPGTSDHRWIDNRFEGGDRWYISEELRLADGGCYMHDAAVKSSPEGVGQGHTFEGNSFRTAAKYLILLDRTNNDKFVGSYGETNVSSLGVKPFAITSRTRYVHLSSDSITASFMVDGVERRSRMSDLSPADIVGTLFSIDRVTGMKLNANEYLPGNNKTAIPTFTSRQSDGGIDFYQEDPDTGARTLKFRMSGTNFRAGAAGVGLGTSSERWGTTYVSDLNIGAVGARVFSGSGSPEGSVTASPGALYLNTAGGSQKPLWMKFAGTGATGWQSVNLSGTNGT